MGNINDAGTLFLQLIYDAKKDFRLPVGQRRGRLIEYQYFGIQGQCLCYLYLLLFRYTELPQPGGTTLSPTISSHFLADSFFFLSSTR